MLIERIKVKNFASYKDAEIDLSKLGGTIAVFGDTGSGKTTFFVDAPTVALYGRAYGQMYSEYAKEVIPSGETYSIVEVDIRIKDKKYRVWRKLYREKPSEAKLIEIDENGNEVRNIAIGVRAVDTKIAELVGFDFQTFLTTVVVRQADVARIISKDISPSERRSIFLKAFNIDFSKHKEKSKNLLEESRRKKVSLEKEKEILQSDVGKKYEYERKLKQLNEEISKIETELTVKRSILQNINDELKSYETARKKLENEKNSLLKVQGWLERIKDLKNEIIKRDKLKEDVKELENKARKLEEFEKELKNYTDKLSEIERECGRVEGKFNYLKESMEKLDSKCPVCKRPITIDIRKHLEEEIQKLDIQKRNYLKEKENIENQRKKLEEKRKESEIAKAVLEEKREQLKKISENEKKLEELESTCLSFYGSIPGLKEIEEKISGVDGKIKSLDSLIEKKEKEKDELASILLSLEKNQSEKKGNITAVKKEIENIEMKEKRLEEVNKELKETEKCIQVFSILYEEIFHEKGFPLTLLKRYLSLVEDKTRNFLRNFLPEWNAKILATEDKVAIDISDGKSERDLVTYSGGEMVLIGFAIRLAIARVLAEERIVTAPKFLIVDEGFGPLSNEFREKVLETFSELITNYEKIIVISHVTEIIESPYFADRIRIYKDKNGRSFFMYLK